MPKMSAREKNLGVIVILVVVSLFQQRVRRGHKEDIDNMTGEIIAAKERVQQSRALMASAPKPAADEPDRRPAALNETTMKMLRDMTVPVEIKDVKVTSVEHPSPSEFRMIVEGRFSGMMRFLSYLERPEGDFKVNHVEIGRVNGEASKDTEEAPANARDLRGTFNLVRRG